MQILGERTAVSQADLRVRMLGSLLFAVVTAVGAQISFRLWFSPVPVTLQVFTVILSGLVLGSRWGAISQIQYLFMGAIGMPVFSEFKSGLTAFAGPTAGYLVGFVVGAFVAGWVFEQFKKKTWPATWIAGIAGIIGIYALGAPWLALWLKFVVGKPWEGCVRGAWMLGVVPFIGVDILKAIVASNLTNLRSRIS